MNEITFVLCIVTILLLINSIILIGDILYETTWTEQPPKPIEVSWAVWVNDTMENLDTCWFSIDNGRSNNTIFYGDNITNIDFMEEINYTHKLNKVDDCPPCLIFLGDKSEGCYCQSPRPTIYLSQTDIKEKQDE